jgi:hypothetical protein
VKNLRSYLVTLGLVVIGGGSVMLTRVREDVTMAELRDAGFQQCPAVDLACDVRFRTDAGNRYARPVIDARDCRALGAGIVITDRRAYENGHWVRGFDVVGGRCQVVTDAPPDDGGTAFRELALECGFLKASGLCRFELPGGALQAVPLGRTVGPGYVIGLPDGGALSTATFQGPGCQRKACEELLGESSWPAECPEG